MGLESSLSPRKLGESPNATVRYLTSRGRSFSDRSLNPSSIYAPKRGIVTIARPQQATAPSLPLQQIPLQSVMEKQATQVRQASHATMGVVAEQEPVVHDIYEEKTGTWQYIVADPSTLEAVIIDPVLDYDSASSEILTTTADSLLDMVHQNKYKVQMILETHAHADHLTAANYLQHKLAEIQGTAPAVGIGKRIADVQKLWAGRYGVPSEEYESVFDKLFDDNEVFHIGSLKSVAIHLPGHTPDHMGYMIGDNVFVGDSMFHADLGSARADFPGGDAQMLFRSGRKLLQLPDHVKIWSGHDYPPEDQKGRVPWMTVRQQRDQNKHLKEDVTETDFVALRQQRDATLGPPKLLDQSLQINIRAGRLPRPSSSGLRMLHVPLKLEHAQW
ncbi:hypothetical protein B0A52_01229 [Exophiala mesophila]|uniref:Metallo-beta-lactamase domain-containing protein n=1 Tax=Exophiala mesophila TaxID=212818 RepID=A0A438NGU5_EXOME|nr:hypothetical protein B0A52_01229 [Exophiala mesophila]